jgi:two-component system cell cycle sensor histidine kinase/response regulator CckA
VVLGGHSARRGQISVETILLVDDDASLRSVAQLILEQAGYRVLPAGAGLEALQLAKEYPGPIHLLVTDLIMPGMDGAELGRQIGSLRLGIPVLYVTAFAVAQLADHEIVLKRIVLEPGVPILAKPFSIEALEKSVREVLDISYQAPPPRERTEAD